MITEIFNKLFTIPLICFFDDFAALLPRELAPKRLAVFARFCILLRIRLKTAKSEVGTAITFLGLHGTFPNSRDGDALRIFPRARNRHGRP